MTELMRPALYGAFHRIEPVAPRAGRAAAQYDIVGPICESSDVVGRDRVLPPLEVGDLVAILDAGAYGVGDGVELQSPPAAGRGARRRRRSWRVIRRRQTVDDMLALET